MFQQAQGDLLILEIPKLPAHVDPVKAVDGVFVVAHSETGHHHVVDAHSGVRYFRDTRNPLWAYLTVEDRPTTLRHLRSWDTHGTQTLPVKTYQLRRQRELTPTGWNRVAD